MRKIVLLGAAVAALGIGAADAYAQSSRLDGFRALYSNEAGSGRLGDRGFHHNPQNSRYHDPNFSSEQDQDYAGRFP